MNSVEVYIIVEGRTEQTFVRDVLAPQMAQNGIFLHAALIGKPGHKGGDIRFERAIGDIGRFLRQRSNTFVSTMFDYFRLESQWPGWADMPANLTACEKANRIETATSERCSASLPDENVDRRVIPYIEMYEFESLLFSDASILADRIGVPQARIRSILNECGEPEEIDDGPNTSPSKRLFALRSDYRKVAMGKEISEAIGLQTIRTKCPHFNAWLSRLEQLV